PVAWIAPIVLRKVRGFAVGREAACIAVGAAVLVCASYAPLGPIGAVRAIRYMVDFQTAHSAREVFVGGHFYVHAPWWADVSFATTALGPVVCTVLAVLALIGLVVFARSAGYAIGVALSI